jgi:multicomponent Na+:H+ antiporter subunit G
VWIENLVSAVLLLGTLLVVVAALGILRMPDLYLRMHAATKAGTVGLGFILLAVALYFQESTVTSRVFGTIFFILLTAPVAAHMIGKAMLDVGYRMYRKPNSVPADQNLDDRS